jgi:hypothetical protein
VCTPASLARATSSSESRTTSRGGAQLLVRLVVPVEDEPLGRNTGAQRELELAARRDVGSQPFQCKQPHQGDVRKCLRPVNDQRLGVDARVCVCPRQDGATAVDDERRAELACEVGGAHLADDELAVRDGGGIREEV